LLLFSTWLATVLVLAFPSIQKSCGDAASGMEAPKTKARHAAGYPKNACDNTHFKLQVTRGAPLKAECLHLLISG
jgi:hypothetical protein